MLEFLRDRLRERRDLFERVGVECSGPLAEIIELTGQCVSSGGTLFFCGNGGSAAIAQHLAAEYVVRFRSDRKALPALALTTDTSALTAIANDWGFEHIFSRQLEALAKEGDIVFLHSTSGRSGNMTAAAETARHLGVKSVGFLGGDGGVLRTRVDRALVVPTTETALAQEAHLALGHEVCAAVERMVSSELEAYPPAG